VETDCSKGVSTATLVFVELLCVRIVHLFTSSHHKEETRIAQLKRAYFVSPLRVEIQISLCSLVDVAHGEVIGVNGGKHTYIISKTTNLAYRGILKKNRYAFHLAESSRCNIFHSDQTIRHTCSDPPTNMEIWIPCHRLD